MILLNKSEIKPTFFPDKTSQVWKIPETYFHNYGEEIVEWKFETESELLYLAQLKDLLNKRGYQTILILNYLPYGRQDKEVSNTTTFALRTFSKLLNTLDFKEVRIIDPHSKVATDLIHRSISIYPKRELNDVIKTTRSDLVCYPDNGATLKYSQLYDYPYIFGEKSRDQLTGNILNYELHGSCEGKTVLIVDDLCDYGNTFIKLSNLLYSSGAKEVNLFVSHGLFSGGINILFDSGIKRIFTKEGEIKNGKASN